MEVKIVSTGEEMAQLQEQWERLEQQDPDIAIYSTYGFVRAWWQSFSRRSNFRLHLVCVYHNNVLVGIGPFVQVERQRGPIRYKILEFAGRGDYLNVLIDRSLNPLTVIKYIFQSLAKGDWDIIQLSYIPASSQLAAYLFKSQENPYFQPLVENPLIDFTAFASFRQYAEENLPANVVKYRNKFSRNEGLRFEAIYGNRNDIFEEISQLHRLEKEYLVGEKGRKERQSLYEKRYVADYIRELFQRDKDILTFTYRGRDNQLIGYKTSFLHKGTAYSWNGAYNPEYNSYSIGKILYYDILEHLFATGIVHRYDFGAGRYQWKFEWTDNFSTTYKYEKAVTGRGKRLDKIRSTVTALRGGK